MRIKLFNIETEGIAGQIVVHLFMTEMEIGEFIADNIAQQLGALGVIIRLVCGWLRRDAGRGDKEEENNEDDIFFQ